MFAQIKFIAILFITTILFVFPIILIAQENPFIQMASKKYADYSRELYDQYMKFNKQDTIEIQIIISQIKEVAQKTGSEEWKLEVKYAELALFDIMRRLEGDEKFLIEKMVQDLFLLLKEAAKANFPQLELKIRYNIIETYWLKIKNYELAFEQCSIQDKRLQEISSEDIPEKAFYYVQIANAHYAFKDYSKSIYYYSKVLEEKDNTRNQLLKQSALNGLGLSYRNAYNDLERSDSCFNEIKQVNYLRIDDEYNRNAWNGIAEGNIGYNMLLRGEYDKAIPLLKNSIEKMLLYDDYGYASGPAINLAEIYTNKGNLIEARHYIDLANDFYRKMPREGRLSRIYEVMSRYFAVTGNPNLSIVYMDSMMMANKQYEEEFNAMLLLRMEQKELILRQQELISEKEKQKQTQFRLMVFSVGFIVILGLLVIVFVLYRRKQTAYRALVIKTQQWAQPPFTSPPKPSHSSASSSDIPTESDRILFNRLNTLMDEQKLFLNFDATLDQIAETMEVNRMYLSQAVNHCTGANFSTFINEFRVKEAVRLMSDKKSQNFSIEGIGYSAGFNDRKTFYRVFKKSTGISPAVFRMNLKN